MVGKCYPCIEILYKNRDDLGSRTAICIACYVTLPKIYHAISIDYGSCADTVKRQYSGLIYSFLLIPIKNRQEAAPIIKLLRDFKILSVLSGRKQADWEGPKG